MSDNALRWVAFAGAIVIAWFVLGPDTKEPWWFVVGFTGFVAVALHRILDVDIIEGDSEEKFLSARA